MAATTPTTRGFKSLLNPKHFWVFFGGLWLVCGLPFFVAGLYLGTQHVALDDRFAAEGRTVEGLVLTKAIRTSSTRNSTGRPSTRTTYEVAFRFPTAAGPVQGRADVSADAWDRLVEREPIAVTYLPDDPERHRIEGQTAGWLLPALFTGLGGVFAALGGFILLRAVQRLRTSARLEREGLTAEATVTALAPSKLAINRVRQIVVHYQYRDQRGAVHAGSETLGPAEAAEWKEGDRARVRYDPRRPAENLWLGKG